MEEFFTLDILQTYAGMVAAVTIMVQFSKGFLKEAPDWWVRILAFTTSMVLQAFVLYVSQGITVETIGLGILNAVLITLAAIGTYEVIADPSAIKTKRLPENKQT